MTYEEALEKAHETANRTGCSTLVYESLLKPGAFGVEFTLPMWGKRVGERIEPICPLCKLPYDSTTVHCSVPAPKPWDAAI
jgi:hypothetical protein